MGKLVFQIRNLTIPDVKDVYQLLAVNRPYVGLNSRYTYFLLAKDFSGTCLVAECDSRIVGFASGYVPPMRPDTFFSWEIVVDKNCRGHGLSKKLLLNQICQGDERYLEATVNPSNEAAKKSYRGLAHLLKAECLETLLFSEGDFEFDGHEPEVLFRIGPFSKSLVEKLALGNSKKLF